MIKMENAKYILIRFKEKEKLVAAFQLLKENGIMASDILSPVPIEELEGEMKERKSYIGFAGFVAGVVALVTVLYFQLWVSGKAYPLFYGGKPFDAWLSFVPVLFESVVLLASLAIVFTFLFETRIFSKKTKLPKDVNFTNDKFAIVLDENSLSEANLKLLNDNFEVEEIEA